MQNGRRTVKQTAFLALAVALALLLSYVEALMPPLYAAVPGITVGLPNVAVLYILYSSGCGRAALVSLTRVFIASLLFGTVMTMAYSLAGAVLSLLVMSLLKRTDRFSAVGVSVAGGVMHNLGQVLVAMFILDTPQIAYYMLVLSVTGILAGIAVGLCGVLVLKRIPPHLLMK